MNKSQAHPIPESASKALARLSKIEADYLRTAQRAASSQRKRVEQCERDHRRAQDALHAFMAPLAADYKMGNKPLEEWVAAFKDFCARTKAKAPEKFLKLDADYREAEKLFRVNVATLEDILKDLEQAVERAAAIAAPAAREIAAAFREDATAYLTRFYHEPSSAAETAARLPQIDTLESHATRVGAGTPTHRAVELFNLITVANQVCGVCGK